MKILTLMMLVARGSAAGGEGSPNCTCNAKALDKIPKFDCDIGYGITQCVKPDKPIGDIKRWQEGDRFYSAKYGASCEAQLEFSWSSCANATTGEFLLQPTASFCTKPWCYVDPCQCDSPDITSSSYFKSYGIGELKYSYATCGGIDSDPFDDGNTQEETDCTEAPPEVVDGATSVQLGGFSMALLVVTMLWDAFGK